MKKLFFKSFSQEILLPNLISSVIGFIAGFMPARSAARLDPVIAMNSV